VESEHETLLEFKIDTCTEVTVIPESIATPFHSRLQSSSRTRENFLTSLWRIYRNLEKRRSYCERRDLCGEKPSHNITGTTSNHRS